MGVTFFRQTDLHPLSLRPFSNKGHTWIYFPHKINKLFKIFLENS